MSLLCNLSSTFSLTSQLGRYRQANAPDLFLGAYIEQSPPSPRTETPLSPRKLIGYVCGTLAAEDHLTHESMSHHVPVSEGGISVCIHSVCIAEDWRKKGVALSLLNEYFRQLETEGDERLKAVMLICHDEFIPFYEKAGFKMDGKSTVVHGPEEWFEMKYVLRREGSGAPGDATKVPTTISPAMLAALSKPSAPSGGAAVRRLVDFSSIQNVVTNDPSSSSQSNAFKLVCPREGCGSVILLKGVGRLVEAAAVNVGFWLIHLYRRPMVDLST